MLLIASWWKFWALAWVRRRISSGCPAVGFAPLAFELWGSRLRGFRLRARSLEGFWGFRGSWFREPGGLLRWSTCIAGSWRTLNENDCRNERSGSEDTFAQNRRSVRVLGSEVWLLYLGYSWCKYSCCQMDRSYVA